MSCIANVYPVDASERWNSGSYPRTASSLPNHDMSIVVPCTEMGSRIGPTVVVPEHSRSESRAPAVGSDTVELGTPLMPGAVGPVILDGESPQPAAMTVAANKAMQQCRVNSSPPSCVNGLNGLRQ